MSSIGDDLDQHWKVLNSAKVVVSNSAKELWENACNYFDWCDKHPIVEQVLMTTGKSAGSQKDSKSTRPYSVKALCIHCGILEEYLRDLRQLKDKTSEYYHVASKILYVIYVQNMEHALIGTYNPIFTAKILNIEKEELPTAPIKIEIVENLPQLSGTENEVLEKLELEEAEIRKAQSEKS